VDCFCIQSAQSQRAKIALPSTIIHTSLARRCQCGLPVRFLLLSYLFLHKVAATCYWQNSTLAPDSPYSIAPDDTACFPDQTNSPCCGPGWTCLSDGVCFIQQGSNDFYYSGGWIKEVVSTRSRPINTMRRNLYRQNLELTAMPWMMFYTE
jgi:hypothetical protein